MQYLDVFDNINLIPADLVDAASIIEAINISQPAEAYHLAAQSFVGVSFEQPVGAGEITGLGVTRVLEAMRDRAGDEFRINVHARGYWIEEFESEGFGYVPKALRRLTMDRYEQLFTHVSGSGAKFKIAKLLYQKGGYVGKKLVLLLHKAELDYVALMFTNVEGS